MVGLEDFSFWFHKDTVSTVYENDFLGCLMEPGDTVWDHCMRFFLNFIGPAKPEQKTARFPS